MADRIDSVMQPRFPTLWPGQPVRDAVAALIRAQASAAPVLDDRGNLVGILTQRDCFRPALAASYYQQWDGTVSDHMTTSVATLAADTDLTGAAEAFLHAPHRAYPVMDEGRVVGMLDRGDLLRAFLEFG